MTGYRVLFRIRGHYDLEAKDEDLAMEEFESLTVSQLLEKAAFQIIDVNKI
ncbi:MAG: hypothetical protein GXO65_03890 [Euryarchaeota archaeon]|nr:hypothetical protein [Euryarchaeota archaeon]